MALEMNATKDYLTECFICQKDYTDPRALPCIHTFCLECLESCREENPSARETMHCPLCQKEFPIPEEGFVGLKKNFFLDRLVKVKTIANSNAKDRVCDECFDDSELTDNAVQLAVQYCVQCSQFLCKACSRNHRRNRLSKDHSLIDLGTESMDVYELLKNNSGTIPCGKHSEEQLQMFCTDCQKFACTTCLDEDHQQHTIRSIKRITDDYQNQLGQLIDDVSSCVTSAEKKIQMLVEEMTDFQRNTDDCQKKILGAIEELKRLVEDQGKVLIDELLSTKQRQLKVLQNEVEELQSHRKLLDHFKNYCSEMMTKSTKIDLCDSFNDLSRQAKELQIIHDSDMQDLTCFVMVLFEKTQVEHQMNYNIVGKLKETVEVFVMQQDIGDQVMEDSANDAVPYFEHNDVLEPFIQDLNVSEKLHETVDTLVTVSEATVQVSKGSGAPNEQISSKIQPRVELKQTDLNTSALDLEPLAENTGPDSVPVSSHFSEFLSSESSSDEHGIERTFEITDNGGDHTFDEPNNDDLINEVIDRSTTNFTSDFVPPLWKELQQSCVSRNATEENVGDITAQKNSFGGTSNSNPTGHLGLGDSAAHPIANTAGHCSKHVYTDNSPEETLENISVPDISVTEAFCDKPTSDWRSDSRSHIICTSNYFPEVSHSSLQSLENSDMQRNKGATVDRHCREEKLQTLGGRQHGVKQLNIKAWLTQTSKKPELELDSFDKTELTTGDDLPDLDIEETEESSSCDHVTRYEEMESLDEETSSQSCSYNFPLTKYVNAASDVGLGFVMRQVSEAGPCWSTDKTPASSNIQIQPADSTQRSKRRLRTSEHKQNDNSKKCKGDRALELIHRIKTGSTEVFGVTSLQNKVYVLRKKSVSIYSIEDPNKPLTRIKLQNAITPFDICACKKSLAIYITDYGNYRDDREKQCIWKITVPVTVSEHKVSRWYCGIREPYTLSVNSAGNVILLRIEADGQQITLEILSDQANLIRRIYLPGEIKNPEHALETSIGSYVICHKRNGYELWTVSEVNKSGEIVRRLTGTEQLSEPKHLALDAEDRVFVADWRNNRVAILDARFNWDHIFFENKEDDKDGLLNPTRLCYVSERKQLIIVSKSLKVCFYCVRL